MLFHLSTLPLAILLGAIVVSTTTSRYEDDDGFPALTDQADHHQQIIYDVDNGVNASFACDVDKLWNDGVQSHINRAPWEKDCEGGHVVSRYLSSLAPPGSEKIRNLELGPDFNHNTGLLTVLSYEYRTNAAPWPGKMCKVKKTLWNDAEDGAKLGERLKNLKVTLPTGFPEQGWTSYKFISIPKSEVEQQCKQSLKTLNCAPGMDGAYVVPSVVNKNNLCVRVAMTGNKWATCYPADVNAMSKPIGSPCP